MNAYDRWLTTDPDEAFETQVAAWKAIRADELHSDPHELAAAVEEYLGAEHTLAALIAALTKQHRNATPADNVILRHDEAQNLIDAMVNKVVNKQAERRDFE
jgi:hypothetical protein